MSIESYTSLVDRLTNEFGMPIMEATEFATILNDGGLGNIEDYIEPINNKWSNWRTTWRI